MRKYIIYNVLYITSCLVFHPLKDLWIEDLENSSLTHPENDDELATIYHHQ